MTWLPVTEHLSHKGSCLCLICCIPNLVLSSLMTYYRVCDKSSTTVSLLEQELLTIPEHPSSPPVFSEVRVAQSLVFCRSLFVFCSSSCSYCTVFPLLYWLPICYLQTSQMSFIFVQYRIVVFSHAILLTDNIHKKTGLKCETRNMSFIFILFRMILSMDSVVLSAIHENCFEMWNQYHAIHNFSLSPV